MSGVDSDDEYLPSDHIPRIPLSRILSDKIGTVKEARKKTRRFNPFYTPPTRTPQIRGIKEEEIGPFQPYKYTRDETVTIPYSSLDQSAREEGGIPHYDSNNGRLCEKGSCVYLAILNLVRLLYGSKTQITINGFRVNSYYDLVRHGGRQNLFHYRDSGSAPDFIWKMVDQLQAFEIVTTKLVYFNNLLVPDPDTLDIPNSMTGLLKLPGHLTCVRKIYGKWYCLEDTGMFPIADAIRYHYHSFPGSIDETVELYLFIDKRLF